MDTLYAISVVFWIMVAFKASKLIITLKDTGLSRREITTVSILLLSGLNISKGILMLSIGIPKLYTGELLLGYFYVGTELFQILVCNIVLSYIKPQCKEGPI